ncbi:hypothetical protein [Accumulibacter sp.]|uniref:hypothetical protein n=1 Tax=Accumulibacter sp. TaxID=2053492 RepID=UPI002613323D|nr:hypothetical protein [Accumulibacter sp.]
MLPTIRRSHLILLALLIGSTRADTLTGTVVSVADGDTIAVLDTSREQHKVRVSGERKDNKKSRT